MSGSSRYGLIEAGGTKFVLGIAEGDRIVATARIPTTTPEETLGQAIDWFEAQLGKGAGLDAIGVASFGPLQLDRGRPDWGHVGQTPKPGWSGADLAPRLARSFGCPVAIDTDVNGAALAEYIWGAGQGCRSLVYLTIGTGIGGGAVIDGKILHGVSHPEMGHFRPARHPDDLGFAGACSFHGDCLEGLASGPAVKARWGQSLSELGPDHPAHEIIAFYLAQAVCTLQAIFEPQRIIFGGGVMGAPGLIGKVVTAADMLGAGYFASDPAEIVVAPGLGDEAGLRGALALAKTLEKSLA